MPTLKLRCDRCEGDGMTPAGHRCSACGGNGYLLKNVPDASFPPHWFGYSRIGAQVFASLVPVTAAIQATQWRLMADGLRGADHIPLIESLKIEPENTFLVYAYVSTLDEAHELMWGARSSLQAFTQAMREEFFTPLTSTPTAPLVDPLGGAPAPPGDPTSFSMEALATSLNLPVPDDSERQTGE